MADEVERGTDRTAPLAVVSVVPVDGTPMWTVRVQVPFPTAPATGWAPFVFFSEDAAEQWLSGRVRGRIMPTVRDCVDGPNDLAVAVISNEDGQDLLVSEPLPRTQAAGVSAMFAAEFRARQL